MSTKFKCLYLCHIVHFWYLTVSVRFFLLGKMDAVGRELLLSVGDSDVITDVAMCAVISTT